MMLFKSTTTFVKSSEYLEFVPLNSLVALILLVKVIHLVCYNRITAKLEK